MRAVRCAAGHRPSYITRTISRVRHHKHWVSGGSSSLSAARHSLRAHMLRATLQRHSSDSASINSPSPLQYPLGSRSIQCGVLSGNTRVVRLHFRRCRMTQADILLVSMGRIRLSKRCGAFKSRVLGSKIRGFFVPVIRTCTILLDPCRL